MQSFGPFGADIRLLLQKQEVSGSCDPSLDRPGTDVRARELTQFGSDVRDPSEPQLQSYHHLADSAQVRVLLCVDTL